MNKKKSVPRQKKMAFSIEEHFSPDMREKAYQVSEMQKWIASISDSNIDDIVKKMNESVFLTIEYVDVFVDTIISIASCRYDLIDILVLFIKNILDLDIAEEIKTKIKNKLSHRPFKMSLYTYQLTLFIKKLVDANISEMPSQSKLSKLNMNNFVFNYEKYQNLSYYKDIDVKFIGENCFPSGSAMLACKEDDVEKLMALASESSFNLEEVVKRYVQSNIIILKEKTNWRNPDLNLLDVAAMFGSVKCFKYLHVLGLKDGASIKNAAICGGSLEIIRILEDDGQDFSDCADFAVAYFRHDLFDWIMETKITGTIPRKTAANSALTKAAEVGDFYILMKALDYRAKIDYKGKKDTALQLCASNGHTLMAELLISSPSCDVNYPPKYSPLILSCQNGHRRIVEMLVEHGANVCIESSAHITPLWMAAASGSLGTVKFLVENTKAAKDKADIGACYVTPFLNAVKNGHLAIAQYLSKVKGVNVKKYGLDHMNALHLAVECDDPELVQFALSLGIDTKLRTKRVGHTPYTLAVTGNRTEALKVLESRDDVYKVFPRSVVKNDIESKLRTVFTRNYFLDKTVEERLKEVDEAFEHYGVDEKIIIGMNVWGNPCDEAVNKWLEDHRLILINDRYSSKICRMTEASDDAEGTEEEA